MSLKMEILQFLLKEEYFDAKIRQHSNVPHTAQLHCVLEMIQKNCGMVMD